MGDKTVSSCSQALRPSRLHRSIPAWLSSLGIFRSEIIFFFFLGATTDLASFSWRRPLKRDELTPQEQRAEIMEKAGKRERHSECAGAL